MASHTKCVRVRKNFGLKEFICKFSLVYDYVCVHFSAFPRFCKQLNA